MKTNTDRINARCEILKSLGFIIDHRDSVVTHPAITDISFDFSETADDMFIHKALQTVRSISFAQGRNSIRAELNNLLTIE